jgi:pyruvate formate lyase activating enzyme
MKEALHYFKENGLAKCRLCPHDCNIPEGRSGFCGVRKNAGGVLYAENYGHISAMHMDPVEKKPLYHFMPGSYTFSIGSFGCNLACPFCQNCEISKGHPLTEAYAPEEIVGLAEENLSPSVSYTYSEPAMFYEFMLDTAKEAKKRDLKNIMVTNGYIRREPLLELLPYLDAMNIDLKTYDDAIYRKVLKGSLQPVLETIAESSSQCHVEVTMLIVPGVSDDLTKIEEAARFLAGIDPKLPLHISRYFPRYKYTEPPTNIALLRSVRVICEKYLKNVHLGNV